MGVHASRYTAVYKRVWEIEFFTGDSGDKWLNALCRKGFRVTE